MFRHASSIPRIVNFLNLMVVFLFGSQSSYKVLTVDPFMQVRVYADLSTWNHMGMVSNPLV